MRDVEELIERVCRLESIITHALGVDVSTYYDPDYKKPIEWKVGEKVWDVAYGWGEVDFIAEASEYIEVIFENYRNSESFYLNGHKIGMKNRTLFKRKMKLV